MLSSQSISNCGDSRSIIAEGVTHDSVFGGAVFSLIFNSMTMPYKNGLQKSKFDTPRYREYFWKKSLAVHSLKTLNAERNCFAAATRDIIDRLNPPPKDDLISQEDMENWGYDNWEPSPYLTKSAEFMSAAMFGREDPQAWEAYLPVVLGCACHRIGFCPFEKTEKAANAQTTNSENNHSEDNNSQQESPVSAARFNNKCKLKFAGKTVKAVMPVPQEGLVRLFTIKHLMAMLFGDNTDILIALMKKRGTVVADYSNIDVNDSEAVNLVDQNTFVPNVSVTKPTNPNSTKKASVKYSPEDIKLFLKLTSVIRNKERVLDDKFLKKDDDNDNEEQEDNHFGNHSFVFSFPDDNEGVSSPASSVENGKRGSSAVVESPNVTKRARTGITIHDDDLKYIDLAQV